jgi:hypothetical protein
MIKSINFHIIFLAFLTFGSSCKEDEILEDENIQTGNIASRLIFDSVNGKDIVIIGNPASEFIVSFEHQLSNGDTPSLEVVNKKLPIILKDEKGNLYDIFGRIVEGENQGEYLLPILSYQSYWFAIAAFFPGVEIHESGKEDVVLDLNTDPDWSIPTSNLFAGTGFDAIPAINNPKFFSLNDIGPNVGETKVPDVNELVIGMILNDKPIAFPHYILNWHEIVNLNDSITISYCPLTGTSIGWNHEGAFGVSGLLYNSNLIAYDEGTESLWSQMLGKSVYGLARDLNLSTINIIETTWLTWRSMYPTTEILSEETGFTRNYDETPYQGYMDNHDLIYYPLDYNDSRLPNKEQVHVVIMGMRAKVYTFDNFK